MAKHKLDTSAVDTGREALSAIRTASGAAAEDKPEKKIIRTSMVLTPQNMEYIEIMSSAQGISMAKFVNQCLARCRDEDHEDFESARQFIEKRRKYAEMFSDADD